MIVVAITQRLISNDTYPETRDCLDVRWASLAARLGVLPLVLPTEYDPAAYFEAFAPKGLILTGGNDLASASPGPLSATRDAFEKRVLELAVARRLPVLAVCRGMQLVGEHFGAPLARVQGHAAVRHALTVSEGTRFGRALAGVGPVNSYHGWAPTSVPAGFVEVARSEDGVLEAMEHTALPIYCQMWHPEREEPLSAHEANVLFELFGTKEVIR